MKLFKTLAISTLALAFSACALSPQKVDIYAKKPFVMATQSTQTLALTVVDQRDSDELGSRGGTYKDTALIKTQNDLIKNLEFIFAQSLAKTGAALSNQDPSAIKFNVLLEQLNYQAVDLGWGKKQIDVAMQISVEVIDDELTLTRNFNTSRQWQRFGYPNEEKNQEYVLTVFDEMMELIINDEELLAYIQ